MKFDNSSNARAQLTDGSGQNLFSLKQVEKQFRTGAAVGRFVRLREFAGLAGLLRRNFSYSALLAKLGERRINRDTRQPGGKAGPSIEVLQMQEGAEERILRGVFSVFAVSRDTLCDAEHPFRMTVAKFAEGVPVPMLGGSHQLFVAPSPAVFRLCADTLYGTRCTHH